MENQAQSPLEKEIARIVRLELAKHGIKRHATVEEINSIIAK